MPSIYAHNKFGKKVLKNLDDKTRLAVREYPNEYRIGLQGPDYLFFYIPLIPNPISRVGYATHEAVAAPLFERGIRVIEENGGSNRFKSYLYGLACHFSLDSECHPYIGRAIKETGVSHVLMESEFDKFLMRRDGVDPLEYPLWDLIPTDRQTTDTVSQFYEEISEETARSAVIQMKITKRLLKPGPVKENLTSFIFYASGKKADLRGHMIRIGDIKKCDETNGELEKLFDGAIPVAEKLIRNLNECMDGSGVLSERFNRNFE